MNDDSNHQNASDAEQLSDIANQSPKDEPYETRSRTQQGAFRKDRNAVNFADNNDISERDMINEIASAHSDPDSAVAVIESAGALLHIRANMDKKSPAYDAVERIKARRRQDAGQRKGFDSSDPDFCPEPS